jgi:hypothetical protein
MPGEPQTTWEVWRTADDEEAWFYCAAASRVDALSQADTLTMRANVKGHGFRYFAVRVVTTRTPVTLRPLP